jgi:hypothetical protein
VERSRDRSRARSSARRRESGAVTAETALALPLIAVFTVSMAWLVGTGITQVRALDAARETARAAARSDGSGQALALGRRVAPAGSLISVGRSDHTVVVTVDSPVAGPAGLFGRWALFRVKAEAVAAEEPTP